MDNKQPLSRNQPCLLTGKLADEFKTITLMTTLYCNAHHPKGRCEDCQALLSHARQKLDRCVYGQDKPACKLCPVHCYKPHYREKTKVIMQYAGPKMLLKHPILTIKHIIKGAKQFPKKIPVGLSNYHQRKKIKL
ncbi:nitrous oxide-stimulated promoter family protein [uncultured Psychromonas sp.]|uniref:nitrous oxide-stimulated promoter family protein n=1 Tax=uncultured Psychromonas sp. TaxID=173974 RepID=UPI002604C240|nr:nitrous oxide-stimulated promoter family protein [uncultured Psychromonas sp.]